MKKHYFLVLPERNNASTVDWYNDMRLIIVGGNSTASITEPFVSLILKTYKNKLYMYIFHLNCILIDANKQKLVDKWGTISTESDMSKYKKGNKL